MKKQVVFMITAAILLGAAVFCGGQLYAHSAQVEKQTGLFEQMAEAVEQVPDTGEIPEEVPKQNDTEAVLPKYRELYLQNADLIGWVQIEGTSINYPVMQTRNNPDYYLKHNVQKEYSDLGVPYLQENCKTDTSDNLILYGHHIRGQKMFGALENYRSRGFYQEHPVIRFDTLTEQAEYEIIAVFQTVAYSKKGFRYYDFVDAANQTSFDAYVNRCKELALYDTGNSAVYGDRLLTLSTCTYSVNHGRLVVVARKKA